jgi:capsular polysaccharide biosynthesis protein
MKKFLSKVKFFFKQYPFIFPRGIIFSAKKWIVQSNEKIDLYARKNSDWYLNFYPENVVCYSKPLSLESELDLYFKKNFVKRTLEANLYFFKGAYVFSNYGIVLSRTNNVFSEFCHYFNVVDIKRGTVYSPFEILRFKTKRFQENIALLAAPESENYYHWIMDSLPRLCLLENFIHVIDYFIVPEKLNPFHIETLKYWGIDQSRLIKIGAEDKLYFENLFVPSLPGSEGNSSMWAVEYLRKKFLVNLNPINKTDYIYFSRKNANSRYIVNESEVIKSLSQRGFSVYEMSSHSFEEQIAYVSKAKVIVSVHGADLTNLLFADNCKVLEIFSPDYIRTDCYFTLAKQLDLEYWYLIGTNTYKSEKLTWGDIHIDIEKLNLTLDRMLNATE